MPFNGPSFGPGENVGRAYVTLEANGDKVPGQIRRALQSADGEVDEAGERHSDAYTRKWEDRMIRLSSRIDDVAEKSGRLFGRGSRNNFLNFLGGAVAGVTRLLGVIPRLSARLIKLGDDAASAFFDAGGGLAGLLAGAGTLGPLLTGAAVGMGSLTVALVAAVPLLAVASTLLLAITGTLIALSGSLLFAAAAGVFALGGAFTVLATGIGVAALAINGMSDAQKKMVKEATEPLVDAFKDLGQASARGLLTNVEQQAKRLTPILAAFEPMFYKIARAVSRVGDSIIDSLDTPEFRNFREQMEIFLPNAVRILGETINNIFGGLGGVFLAMRPFIRDFLNGLEDITQEFSDWANSKEGRKEIREFLEDAADSAESVGDFLGKVVDLFGTLFEMGGRETGDDIFDSLTKNIEEFITFLEENPDAVKKFFEDAKDIADDIGDIVVAIGNLIGKLDDLAGHPITKGLLLAIELGFKQVAFWADAAAWAVDEAGQGFGYLSDKVGDAKREIEEFLGDSRRNVELIIGIFTGLPGAVGRSLSKIPGQVRVAFSGLGGIAQRQVGQMLAPFATFVGKAMQNVRDLPGRVRELLGRLPGIAGSAVGRVIAQFGGFAGKVMGHINDLPGRVREMFHRVLDYVRDIPGRIVGFFTGLAGRILSAIGTIDIGSLVDLSGIPFLGDGAVSKNASRADLLANAPQTADGMWYGKVTRGAQLRWVGEDGPEAIVPLARDLSKVDPSVRWLSALAQGKGMASGGVSTGKSIDASGWIIQTPGDPKAAAQEVINRLFAQSF